MAPTLEIKLVVREGQGKEKTLPFSSNRILIGRDSSCDVQLQEITAGREHARIEVSEGGSVTVVDLGTSTGTRLNGIRVQGSLLVSDGDVLQVGEANLTVQFKAPVRAASAASSNQWSQFERVDIPVLNIAQVWGDNVMAVKRFGRSIRHLLHTLSFLVLTVGMEAVLLYGIFQSLQELYRVGQLMDYGPAMTAILACFIMADIVIVLFTLDLFQWPRESQAKNVIIGEGNIADFFVPAEKLGEKEYKLIETFEGRPALNLKNEKLAGKVMVGDQILTIDQLRKTSLVRNQYYLPLTYKIRARIEFNDVTFILGLDPSMTSPKGAFLSRINLPMAASFCLAFVLAGMFLLAVMSAPKKQPLKRVSSLQSRSFRTLIKASKQKKEEDKEEEKKKLEIAEEKKEEVKLDEEDTLQKEVEKAPMLEVKETVVKKRVVSPTQVKVAKTSKTMDTSLKHQAKTQKKYGPTTALSQAERRQKVRNKGALAALQGDGAKFLGSEFGDDSMRVDSAYKPQSNLAIGGDGGGGSLDVGGSAGGDPFQLSEIEGQEGGVGGDAGPGGTFGGSVGADGRLVDGSDGKIKGASSLVELSKKRVATSVKGPKFTADKLKVSPSGDFGMDGSGRLDKRIVKQYIRKQIASIRWCYQRAFQKNQELEGKMTVQFIISANGKVISSKVLTSNLGDAELDNCVAGKVLNWKFPAPEGGGIVKVNYPFVFRRQ